jgi:DNA-directed RNA polymerase specialized sigma24 family protein
VNRKEVLVAGFERDYIYCSPLLPVQSLECELTDRRSNLYSIADCGDPADVALIKKLDRRRLRRWVGQLPAPLQVVAWGILRGETQAALARALGISEPAVKKRLDRISELARRQLRDLRRSPLLA